MKTLDQALLALQPLIEKAAHQTAMEAGELGAKAARDTKLFHNDGPLRDATNWHPIDQYSGFILADKEYATYLEDGNPSEGFIIKPIRAKTLHFWLNGEERFVKSVKAHGPLPFMQQSQDKVESEIEQIWESNWHKVVGE